VLNKFSRWKIWPSKQVTNKKLCFLVDPEDGGSIFLRNSDKFLRDYTALYPERRTLQVHCLEILSSNKQSPKEKITNEINKEEFRDKF
jgi:hypothetical protein